MYWQFARCLMLPLLFVFHIQHTYRQYLKNIWSLYDLRHSCYVNKILLFVYVRRRCVRQLLNRCIIWYDATTNICSLYREVLKPSLPDKESTTSISTYRVDGSCRDTHAALDFFSILWFDIELALINSHDKQSFVSMCFGIFAETLPISQQSKRITSSRGVVLVHVLG